MVENRTHAMISLLIGLGGVRGWHGFPGLDRMRPPDPASEHHPLSDAAPFYRVIEFDAAEAGSHSDAFDELRRDRLHAVIVHGVYSPETLAPVVERLERHDPPFLQTWFPEPFRSFFYGRNLNLAAPDLAGYFGEARDFSLHLRELFPAGLALERRVTSVLSAIDRGRRFGPPPGPRPGEAYMFTTLRAHLEGGYIPAHFDNEMALRPSYRHLMTLIEPRLFSFVLALTRPEAGGALEVFDFTGPPLGERPQNVDGRARPDLSSVASVSFRLPPGSMIVMDSGRFLHRVTPVSGPIKRWTACSFMAESRSGDGSYCWG
jgi:hypothetical protein